MAEWVQVSILISSKVKHNFEDGFAALQLSVGYLVITFL